MYKKVLYGVRSRTFLEVVLRFQFSFFKHFTNISSVYFIKLYKKQVFLKFLAEGKSCFLVICDFFYKIGKLWMVKNKLLLIIRNFAVGKTICISFSNYFLLLNCFNLQIKKKLKSFYSFFRSKSLLTPPSFHIEENFCVIFCLLFLSPKQLL